MHLQKCVQLRLNACTPELSARNPNPGCFLWQPEYVRRCRRSLLAETNCFGNFKAEELFQYGVHIPQPSLTSQGLI